MNKKWIWIGIGLAGLLSICILVAGAGVLLFRNWRDSAQANQWRPENSTKGMSLTLTEVSREKDQNGGTVFIYDVSTKGVPKGQTYTLWGKNFPNDSPMQIGEFRIDDSGKLIDLGYLGVGQYAMGQAVNIALMNSDESIRVYAKAIPIPIEATDGSCYLSVELLSRDGHFFMISGRGFEPNEEIVTNDFSMTTADSNGTFRIFEAPDVIGKQSGTAYLNAIGKQCNLTVQYVWGAAALQIK